MATDVRSAAATSTTRPARTSRSVGWWLVALCVVVTAMVVVGGLTRLTHSGLSMVEWQPQNVLPPLSEAAWQEAFADYQRSPEFLKINTDMDLTGFKGIFWLEYIHRVVARLFGVVLIVPFVWFLFRRAITRPLVPRLVGVLALAAAQGVMGWLMVASGLVDRPDVSHYRLALHLLLAFALFAWMLWLALGILLPDPPTASSDGAPARGLRGAVLATGALMLVTSLWGAFVAGLDAGFIYNRFPLMGDTPWPDGMGGDGLAAALVENLGVVQFVHRILAIATFALAIVVLVGALRAMPSSWRRTCVLLVPAAAAVQFVLGVSTLVLAVPTALGVMHQAGALVLLAAVVAALSALRGRSAGGVAASPATDLREVAA